ncbi:hypothetical protein SLNWT_1167 [Streptomyces albus]|uniref:Uncharacterized protein n=1 Tax=Streptomyces albus (strain ATCC 21838 / DSM 41398 / FERM P-419 / JCM 4703 / NBRC 107858) TaxID=1081613 RepID=A0A0B5EH90_STRA4|nr:hypothetical protein SLNWT_1167 [Streptomyces albus]AOU75858.1 hypothetical protein SLNHY_1167 [Streptomyces albus]
MPDVGQRQGEQVVCGYGLAIESRHGAQHGRTARSDGTPIQVTDGSTSSESHSQAFTARCSLVTAQSLRVIDGEVGAARHNSAVCRPPLHSTPPRTPMSPARVAASPGWPDVKRSSAMRLSLAPRRASGQLMGGPGRHAPIAEAPAAERDHVVAATETVTLVLGEDSPLPESPADVEDLVRLLRGHVAQLGPRTVQGTSALLRAQQLCSESIPEGYMPSRVYLVRLAEATRELTAHVASGAPDTGRVKGRWHWRKPPVNVLRGAVFTLALACLALAASVPRT